MSDVKRLHLGAGKSPLPSEDGWINLDMSPLPGIDVVFNLDECATKKLPFADDTFDGIYGCHVIEHIVNTLPLMQELHRVSKKDSTVVLKLPFGGSDDAFENPTHVRPYFLNSFSYFSQPLFWREDYGYRGDFINEKIVLIVSKEEYGGDSDTVRVFQDVMSKRNIVQEMTVFLKVVKPIREPLQELQIIPKVEFLLA